MSLTNSQEKAIQAINTTFHNVEVNDHGDGYVFVSCDNGKEHILLNVSYNIRIGKRGRLIFIGASNFGSDTKHERVLASLACFKLSDNGYHSTKVKFV